MEIAIILSVFPIPEGLDEKDFIADEIDCHTIASIFQGHEFGLMRVTQEGLVVRCMKHLVVSLSSESEQRGGMASIDSAMRWDEKAGNMIVLMQYGWPYWRERTNFWHKITQRMKEKRVFKNREFLEYVYGKSRKNMEIVRRERLRYCLKFQRYCKPFKHYMKQIPSR